jgi:hypothetical protein
MIVQIRVQVLAVEAVKGVGVARVRTAPMWRRVSELK